MLLVCGYAGSLFSRYLLYCCQLLYKWYAHADDHQLRQHFRQNCRISYAR